MNKITPLNKNIQKLVTDPKTGQTYKVTQEMIIGFERCEQNIRTSMASIALSLKEIRDQKYYLLIGLTTMDKYIEERFTKSRRQAYFYMKLADAYSNSPHYEEITQLPQKLLTESFKDENILKQLQKGEFRDNEDNIYSFDEISAMGNQDFQVKFTSEKKKLKDLKIELEQAKQEIELNTTRIKGYEEIAGSERIQKITSEKETLKSLYHTQGLIAQIAEEMDRIEVHDNIEIVSLIKSMIGQCAGLIDAVEDKWAVNLVELNRSHREN